MADDDEITRLTRAWIENELLKRDPEKFARADQDMMREIATFRQAAKGTPKN